jgi:16S rRNA (cytosine967-C5)-methyltransferase
LVEARRNTFKSPKPDASRLLAFDLISEVNRNNGYSNLLLPQALTESSSEVDEGIVDVARMGVHQLHEMRIPDHAAVAATVEVARKRVGESKASFVNALLRNVTRKSMQEWFAPLEDIKEPIERMAIQYSHPEWIISAYYDLLKDWDQVELALAINNVPALPTLVAWPGYSSQADLIAIGAEPTKFSALGARWKGNPGNLELIRHRLAGVQDEGSQLVATLFASFAGGGKWLDLCAGPGGKAALLAAIARERSIDFTANEISTPRAQLVKRVVHGARVWIGDGRDIASHNEKFDAILIDAPCTGLGALRRRPEVRWRRNLQDLRELTALQRELIESAVSILEPHAVLGYATCSPHLAETTVQVNDILKKHPELELLDITPNLPSGLEGAVRGGALALWTHKHGTDAMFLAIFVKRA